MEALLRIVTMVTALDIALFPVALYLTLLRRQNGRRQDQRRLHRALRSAQ
jgi:hypothetical protein